MSVATSAPRFNEDLFSEIEYDLGRLDTLTDAMEFIGNVSAMESEESKDRVRHLVWMIQDQVRELKGTVGSTKATYLAAPIKPARAPKRKAVAK
jgi:hypothetical protein